MPNDISIIRIIMQASTIVQIVLALLAFASLLSWAIIFQKRMLLRRARHEAEQFENSFWSGGDLAQLYRGIEARGGATGMSSIFEFGFREFARLRQQGSVPPDQLLDGARRAMRVAQLKEVDRLEYSLATLATVGSTSPYVGLFGTVWGIMSAFASLGNVQQATLSMVAPGISEALIATAMGLFAAIPAVVAFNRFADQVGRLEVRYDAFMEEFSSILQRHAARAPERAAGGHGSTVPAAGAAGALPSFGTGVHTGVAGGGAGSGGAR
jgi:biopolymer transport protein TolQ